MSNPTLARAGTRPRINRLAAAIALAGSLVGFTGVDAHAGAVIYNSPDPFFQTVALGVNDQGHLNVSFDNFGNNINVAQNAGATGIAINLGTGDGSGRAGYQDATSPGCLCEGWGVAVTLANGGGDRISGFASVDNGGIGGLTGGTFGATTTSATSTVGLSGALDALNQPLITVTHTYGVSLAPNTFQGNVTIRNNTDQAIADVVYRRAMDWDVPPTEFNEYVTHSGIVANLESNGGNVRFASDNGFATVNPLFSAGSINPETENTDFVDNGIADHGSVFDFAFGSLAAGESRTFNIFYGAFRSEADALAAVAILNPNIYSLGQPNFNSGGGGEGGGGCEIDCGEVPLLSAASTVASGFGSEGDPTFLFAFGGVGGVAPGSDPSNPILPFVPAPGQFFFENPVPRRWYDPPMAFGFDYFLDEGEFLSAMTPTGVGDLIISVDGHEFTLHENTLFDFLANGFDDVETFRIFGTGPDFDAGEIDALPTFLDFSTDAKGLRMVAILTDPHGTGTPVPAPGALVLLLIGVAGLRRARRA